MKKFVVDETSTYYVYRDQIAILRKRNGQTRISVPPMSDVNDSELRANPAVAKWVNAVARRALDVRDEHGKVVGIDKDALSFDETMLGGVWSKMQLEAVASETDGDDEDFTPEEIESIKSTIAKKAAKLTPEQKAKILKNIENDM